MTIFFYMDWPDIRKSEIPLSEFCLISGYWDEIWILNFARMSLIESYWMLRSSRVVAFTVFELLRENELGLKLPPPPTHQPTHTHTHTHRLGLKCHYSATVKHPTLKIKLRTQKLSILPSELNTWDYILINCIKCNRRHLNCQLDIFLLGCNSACYSNFKVHFFIGTLHYGRTKKKDSVFWEFCHLFLLKEATFSN